MESMLKNLSPARQNSFESYLAQINQIPLLTSEEEFELAVRYLQRKDVEAACQLITSNLRFVVKVAFQYRSYGITLADLVQEGNMGLMMAVKKFDPYRGYRFISYAVWWVRAYIQTFIIKNWSLVRIGTTQAQKKFFYKIGKVRKTLESDPGDKKRYEILANDLDVPKKDIIEMGQRMSTRDLSLESTFDENHELKHLDLLQDGSPDQEELVAQEEERSAQERNVHDAMKRLSEREIYVIRNRIMADEPLTLQEIGEHLNVSRERVRQIQGEALRKLKGEFSVNIPPA